MFDRDFRKGFCSTFSPMELTTTRHPTPEDILTAPQEPLLKLGLICNKCKAAVKHEFEYALVNPNIEKADGWDGVLLPRIIECTRCGAVDDYTISPLSYLKITSEMALVAIGGKYGKGARPGSRIVFGISQLWDGTTVHRASQAISHLTHLTKRHPQSAKAWCCLGNAQERFGQLQQAEVSWRKAIDTDPEELEATYSLAESLGRRDQWPEAFELLRQGIRLLPKADGIDPDLRLSLSRALVDILWRILDVTDEPIALMASWSDGQSKKTAFLTVSSVDIRRVDDWDRLAEFLVTEDVFAADLTAEVPEEEPTILERRLAGDWIESALPHEPAPPLPVVNPQHRVGRNAPCPCSSGKKYKRCCGR
ncbi:MAG: hypothetical protein GY854_16440 [Deltaproteobacteria bacterium]|nr:hypothetical protein [Deltaproteobacteria bacterium]